MKTREEYIAEAEAQSAKRKSWLPEPPVGFCWRVVQLRGNVYEIVLSKPDTSEYTKGYLAGWHGRIRWWLGGVQTIREFDRFKQKSITADEFVRRWRAAEMRMRREELN